MRFPLKEWGVRKSSGGVCDRIRVFVIAVGYPRGCFFFKFNSTSRYFREVTLSNKCWQNIPVIIVQYPELSLSHVNKIMAIGCKRESIIYLKMAAR